MPAKLIIGRPEACQSPLSFARKHVESFRYRMMNSWNFIQIICRSPRSHISSTLGIPPGIQSRSANGFPSGITRTGSRTTRTSTSSPTLSPSPYSKLWETIILHRTHQPINQVVIYADPVLSSEHGSHSTVKCVVAQSTH